MDTINREAADKSKGFRLQKIRAIQLMIKESNSDSRAIFYTAIEHKEDVSHTTIKDDGIDKTYEEDKNYKKGINFTVVSNPVLNALVSFMDIYVRDWNHSTGLNLCFYTTAGIGKEVKILISESGFNIHPPKFPILGTLSNGGALDSQSLLYLRTILLQEYKSQYSGKNSDGYLTTVENMNDTEFENFLGCVSWAFGSEDEVKAKQTSLELIKASPFFNIRHGNKEELIFAAMMDKLDERQTSGNLSQKVLFSSDIQLIFKAVESELDISVMDPVWEMLHKAQAEITDKRNLREKITDVCEDFSETRLETMARIVCRSKIEQSHGNKSFLSLKYRIYESCFDYISSIEEEKFDADAVEKVISDLSSLALEKINVLKTDYEYTISNKEAIDGVVLDLFDGCFIAFDKVVPVE